MRFRFLIAIMCFTITVAVAHQGVTNPAVMARMHGMTVIAAQTKVLGQMAKGQTEFNSEKAGEALTVISAEARKIPGLFKAEETDPKSEAKDDIWSDFDDFSAIAKELEAISLKRAGDINNIADVRVALNNIGASCKACHKKYRE